MYRMKATKMKPQRTVPPRTAVDPPRRRNDDGDVTMHVHVGGYSKKRSNSLKRLLPIDGNKSKD
jgi:hypothetical protein